MGRPLGSKNKSSSIRNFWAGLTPDERSAEMTRRHAVARRNRESGILTRDAQRKRNRRAQSRNQSTTQSPFADLEKPAKTVTSTSLREYISNLEEAVATLKSFLGY